MGKRIIQQARGKGGPTYRSPSHRFAGPISYPPAGKVKIIDIVNDPARDSPLAKVVTSDKEYNLVIAAEGLKVGDTLDIGKGQAEAGNILPLSVIPKGFSIFAIENIPGAGPQLCCSSGTHATIVSQETKGVIIKLPSKQFKRFNSDCLATIGVPAGGGRRDKPFVRAGQKYHAMHARNKLYPRTSAVAMNAVDHPFGGQTKPGQPKTISRHAPPGQKVGTIASRRTGRKKRG